MGQYYLGLLLKYQSQEKFAKSKEIPSTIGFEGVWFPKVRRVFPTLIASELVPTK